MTDHISLKWGTLKSWKVSGDECMDILKKWAAIGYSHSAMTQNDTPEQKQLICDLIDKANIETVYLDWDNIDVSKEDAKKYVMNYGKK